MNFKDLERLQRRIERLQAQKRPPRLKCVVVQDGEESPAPEILNDPFTLVINVEGKGEHNL
jgi:hypothetical protein